jgi:hypothetical protein
VIVVDYAVRTARARTTRRHAGALSFRGRVLILAALGCAAFWAGAAALMAIALRL